MYSFRLNKDLVDSTKKIAKEMGISLSLFISCLLKEKVLLIVLLNWFIKY